MLQQPQPSKPARLTVAFPLYKGARWEETVVENIRHLPDDVRIILSDEVSSDDTAEKIANRFVNDPRIEVRMRNGLRGWRAHCNALIDENNTEFFCLLPQDDLIEPDYFEKLVAALDANPDAGLAFPRLFVVAHSREPVPAPSTPFELGKGLPWIEAILLERYWNLGIPFRGVIRSTVLRHIPSTPSDHFADQLWVFSMALSAFLLEVPEAIYTKRYHGKNTHTQWQTPSTEERKAQLIHQIKDVSEDHDTAETILVYLEQVYACLEKSASENHTSRCEKFCNYLRRLKPTWILGYLRSKF